jgi:hypothetical protein
LPTGREELLPNAALARGVEIRTRSGTTLREQSPVERIGRVRAALSRCDAVLCRGATCDR